MKKHWREIRWRLIERVDADYGVYVDGPFVEARFEAYLAARRIGWPRTEQGHLDLQDETFKDMQLLHPEIGPLRTLRKTLAQSRNIQLTVGSDNRNRFLQSPFGTITGRNTPSTTKNIFGLPKWMRCLIKPPKGNGLAYTNER